MARSICLRALTGAPKTRQQLADLLAKRGVPDDAAERVLDRFGEVGLIDDAAFARAWVTSRQAGRGLSRRALKAELRAKGIDGEVAAEAVTLVDDQHEWDAARRLVARRVAGLRRVDRVTAERRLIGMLARKGYGGGLASWVVREALDEDAAAQDAAADEPSDDGPVDVRAGSSERHPELGLDAWLP
ncbi:regulatory protein RecX [Geodermatophilus sabuli]|uniref:regulatory protein RecX n=1 Tax=Geodermatophilus sabuli TaxID=1564158 RepID=UPI0017F29D24|nr:regulatory protein RecX [Geodermatophilus sabuli]MBB3086457.1 regulatory protein [Geodermatophilus sabuli]